MVLRLVDRAHLPSGNVAKPHNLGASSSSRRSAVRSDFTVIARAAGDHPPAPTPAPAAPLAAVGREIFRGHIPELDALRAVGIVAVLLNHAWPQHLSYMVWAILQLAWAAMDAFFVLSGFLIAGILLDTRANPDYYRTFYTRRALRILPLYYLVVVALTCASFIGLGQTATINDWGSPFWFFVYLGNIPTAITGHWPALAAGAFVPLWSLQLEEQFYLFFPPLVRRLRLGTLAKVLAAMVIFSPVLSVVLYVWYPDNALVQYVFLPCRLSGFALGALLAIRFRRGPWAISKGWLTCVMVAGLLATAVLGWESGLFLTQPVIRTVGFLLSSLTGVCLVLWLIVFRRSPLTACLRLRPVQHLGRISYGIYLLHWPVMAMLVALVGGLDSPTLAGGLGRVVLVPLVTIGLASLSWRYLERPMLGIKDRLAPAHVNPQASSAGMTASSHA